MKVTFFFAVVFCAYSFVASAQDIGVGVGLGTTKCANFAMRVEFEGNAIEEAYFIWAHGFMTALNVSRITNKQPVADFKSRSIPDQMAALRAYCRENLLEMYAVAVGSLYESFRFVRVD
jgi:hypothetical protein